MPEIKQLFHLNTLPGIKRDGTELDGENYTDGQWVRFQRGRPKRMGGYVRVTDQLPGPIRSTLVWSKSNLNNIYTFHQNGINMIQVDQYGLGSSIINRTPSGFTGASDVLWSVDTMYDAAAGSNKTLVLALPASIMQDIDSTTERYLYVGDVVGTGLFTVIADSNGQASGGVFATPPYAVLYGNDGKVTWSNANEPQNYTTGDAGTARVTGSKIVKGLSMRSGSGPGGILWSLDSVIRMDYIGGPAVFRFTTISRQSSIMSPNSVVEYDGIYYWVGSDRFLMCNGSQVTEIPNDMNLNWFYDNINKEHMNKVWGMKIPRYGEIWWFFPKDDNTECSHAVIYNIREQTWYDCELPRSAGYHQQVFNYPVMSGTEISNNRNFTLTTGTGSFNIGDTIIGDSSGARGSIYFIDGTTVRISMIGSIEFVSGEGVTNQTVSGTGTMTALSPLYSIYIHERGKNAVIGEVESSIKSWFTTGDIGLATGGVISQGSPQGLNRWTRLVRIEPDFLTEGSMTLEVIGKEFANEDEVISGPFTFTSDDGKVDLRVQHRHMRLRFTTNADCGCFEMGRVILHTEPGDIRS
jgi:hypothetical protein